jgi:hypothetical protein
MATSWLLLPYAIEPVKAQTATDTYEVAPANLRLGSGWKFSYESTNTSKPSNITFSWQNPLNAANAPGDTIPHTYQLQYVTTTQAPSGMSDALCRKATDWRDLGTAQQDSPTSTGVRTVISIDNARGIIEGPSYFRLVATESVTSLSGGRTSLAPLRPPQILSCGKKTIANSKTATTDKVSITFASEPGGATVTVDGKTLQEFGGASRNTTATTTKTITILMDPATTSHSAKFTLSGYKEATTTFSLSKNTTVSAKLEKTGSSTDSSAVSAEDTGATAGGVEANASRSAATRLFGSVKSTNEDGGDIRLVDADDTTQPPHAIVAKTATKLTFDLDFTLTNTIRSSTTFWGTQNNYFLFTLQDLTTAQTTELKNAGITDPSLHYLAIDAGGNIGFLVNDVSNNGGIFSKGKDKLDVDATNTPIAVGSFSGGDTGVSKNTNGEPLVISLEDYRKVITRRVYNEPNTEGGSICGKVINHPDTNTGYDDPPASLSEALKDKIPIGEYRSCLHINTPSEPEGDQGWLTVWKVEDTKIDQSTAGSNQCVDAFKGLSIFGVNILGGAICGMLGILINGATWIAALSVDFLIESVGLQ